MAKIEKYSTGIVGVIKHNIREFKDGRCPTNLEVDPKEKQTTIQSSDEEIPLRILKNIARKLRRNASNTIAKISSEQMKSYVLFHLTAHQSRKDYSLRKALSISVPHFQWVKNAFS